MPWMLTELGMQRTQKCCEALEGDCVGDWRYWESRMVTVGDVAKPWMLKVSRML